MAKRARLPLLTLLGVLALAFFALPKSALAFAPYCTSGAGHYSERIWLTGTCRTTCSMWGPTQNGRIGYTVYEWDCVNVNGQLQPQNVHPTSTYINMCNGTTVCM